MSEKRFSVHEYGDFYDNKAVTDGGHKMDEQECADLLNEQAETIHVLQEWILNTPINDDFDSIDDFERKLIRIQSEGGCGGMEERVELAKRRIAALEGK